MKKVMVAFLFCTVTASQPAIAAVRRTPIDDKLPQLAIARASADNAHVLADLLAITPVIPGRPAVCCGIMNSKWLRSRATFDGFGSYFECGAKGTDHQRAG
jgi:hypothetical protein